MENLKKENSSSDGYIAQEKALRFISAYNMIDNTLRSIYDFKRSMSFADMIRRSASLNHTVRKYEDKIVDYGKLRNAIVHSASGQIIAEPHDDVVEEFENIARLICTPPKALKTIATRDIVCVDHTQSLKEVMRVMSGRGYKSMPVYKDGLLVGVANAGQLFEAMGRALEKHYDLDDYINQTNIGDVLENKIMENYYAVLDENASIENVLDKFSRNRKMQAVIITPTGNYLERPLGIITVADIMDMNKILELY